MLYFQLKRLNTAEKTVWLAVYEHGIAILEFTTMVCLKYLFVSPVLIVFASILVFSLQLITFHSL